MCADKNIDNSQFLWENEPYAHTPNLTLGQMIDGFRQMSDEDKQAFMLVTGLVTRTAATVVTAASSAVALPAVAGNEAVITAPGPVMAQGPHAVQMVRQGAQVSTKDPKTGKVYRVVAPTTRTNQYVGLENDSLRARQALNAYMKRNGYNYNYESKLLFQHNSVVDTPSEEYNQLVTRVKATIEAVKAYKKAHPEEFRPPVPKGGKTRIADQGTSAQKSV